MILTWILVNLTILTSGIPENRRSVIFFPDEVNIGTEENGDGLEEFNTSSDDKLWVPENDTFNRNDSDDTEPHTFIREEDYFVLPDWMDIDLNEISLDKLAVLNNASDLMDLVELFGLDYEKAINQTGHPNWTQPDQGTELKSSNFVEKSNEMAKFAKCRPEKETVELAVPEGALYIPTCVRLWRCGGCCNSPLLECQPTKTDVVSLTVMKMTKAKSRPRRSRQRRGTTAHMMPMDHENHVECSCQCKVQERHCDLALHNYYKDACACVCKDEAEQMKCEISSHHKWDNKRCSCMCKQEKKCSTGEIFSQDTCGCAVGRS